MLGLKLNHVSKRGPLYFILSLALLTRELLHKLLHSLWYFASFEVRITTIPEPSSNSVILTLMPLGRFDGLRSVRSFSSDINLHSLRFCSISLFVPLTKAADVPMTSPAGDMIGTLTLELLSNCLGHHSLYSVVGNTWLACQRYEFCLVL